MLSTLKLTVRLSRCHSGPSRLVTATAQASANYTNNQHIDRKWLHNDRKNAPEIQEYEPFSNLPYYDGKKGHLMYVGSKTKIVKGIKMFSLNTSLVSLGSIPLVRSALEVSLTKAGVMGGIGSLIFLTPLLLHFVTKKYVTDIYFNAKTEVFTMATKSLFLRRKEMRFCATDVEVPFVGGAFVTHIVKKKAVFIERELFFNKDVYIKMVGYDQPIKEEGKDSKLKGKLDKSLENMREEESKDIKDFGLFSAKDSDETDRETIKQGQKLNDETSEAVGKTEKKRFGLFNEKN